MSCIVISLSDVSGMFAFTASPCGESLSVSASSEALSLEVSAERVGELSVATDDIACGASFLATKIGEDVRLSFSKICTLAEFLSCFGNGLWVNKSPWLNSEGWEQ